MSKPRLSAIICTYNPRPDIFDLVLNAIGQQTLAKDEFELIIVDNNSTTPLSDSDINRGRSFNARVIREERQGNVFARQTGVAAAGANVLVFIDDDNIVDPDYFQTGLDIAARHPEIGAFGGITRGHLERDVTNWKKPLLPFLGVRDYGASPITSKEDRWGEWEPIGAGMVFRKCVADKYVQMVSQILTSHTLGRKGNGLLAGEDSLLARASYRLDLACSYQPDLKLTHFIKKERLTTRYLCRLLLGHGRSVVSLNNVLGIPSGTLALKELFQRLQHRCSVHGRAGLVWWCWDLGYMLEARSTARAATA